MDTKQRYFWVNFTIFFICATSGFICIKTNNQLPHYVAYHPDPGALHVNTFTIPWQYFYTFPPFALLGKKLQKLISDRSTRL